MTFDDIINISPYSLNQDEKEKLLTARLSGLTSMHRAKCRAYDDILKAIGYDDSRVRSYKDIPFLPVRLFKDMDLKSVDDDQIVKTMTSSGTSGQKVSKIYLDRITASNQQKTMVKIVSSFTGAERMPMIIIDCPSVIKNRNLFSARGAGILGFSMFGSKKIYALKDDMTLDVDALSSFINENKGRKILLFGFTFMIWKYFYMELLRLKSEGTEFDLSDGILIHGGGWKKLINESVSPSEFKNALNSVCRISRVHDYYGMVEQTGCIYMQCECGHLHASIFSDVIVRRYEDFSECETGEKGLIQVVSTIPESYPGHSLLTEDEGRILGVDDCPCGRKGKYFEVIGRIKKAEIRGCSDTFAAGVEEKNDSLKVNYLVGDEENIKAAVKAPVLTPFDNRIIDFCSDFSSKLLKSADARNFPDVVSLAFWLRRSSVTQMKDAYLSDDRVIRCGRGVIFHIAPSNVAVNYAYSLFSGLLCGNANIVRVPSRDFPQVKIINDYLVKVLDYHPDMKKYITVVRYERSKAVNDYFSSLCNVRVIWGGDNTIASLRESPIPASSTEVTFADRYSLAVMDSDAFVESNKEAGFIERFVSDFYNDTYLSDQNACTSPRIVVWTGKRKEEAKEILWKNLKRFADDKYYVQPIFGVDKLSLLCRAAAEGTDYNIRLSEGSDNLLYRVRTDKVDPALLDYRGTAGYFYEYDCNDICSLFDLCNDTGCQTIALFGSKDIVEPLINAGTKGIYRIASIGHTMDFSLIWDGYNLVDCFTRSVSTSDIK